MEDKIQLNIVNFLRENGYQVQEGSNYINFPALFRGGDNVTSVTGYLNKDLFIDWVTCEKFNTESLIRKVLNLEEGKNVKDYLNSKNISLPDKPTYNLKNEVKIIDIFPEEVKDGLIIDYSYLIGRGISESICEKFECGVFKEGRYKDRFTFIIRNSKNQLIGLTGRDLLGIKKVKYMHSGSKSGFVWPAQINSKIINDKKEVILVESPMDVLTFFECGIYNVLCLFGTELHLGVLNYLLRINPKKIIIATNNEIDLNGGVGNEAAIKIKNKLNKYFDNHISSINLPPGKDFNEILIKEGKDNIIKWCELHLG